MKRVAFFLLLFFIFPLSLHALKLSSSDLHRLERHYPKTLEKLDENQPLDIQDIINLTRAGVEDDVILYEITLTRSSFFLTPEDEQKLAQAGVSKKVINAMKQTVDDGKSETQTTSKIGLSVKPLK